MVQDVAETALFYQDVPGFTFMVGVADFEAGMSDGNIVVTLSEGLSLDWAKFFVLHRSFSATDRPALSSAVMSFLPSRPGRGACAMIAEPP